MTTSKTKIIYLKNNSTGKYVPTEKNSPEHLKLLVNGFVQALTL